MKYKWARGFSLLEVLLAVIVIMVAGLGTYSLFQTGVKDAHLSDAADEAVQIANVYTDLASSNLTSMGNDIPSLLQNSGRLSTKYFDSTGDTVTMYNAFGTIKFNSPSPYSFTVGFPLGCSTTDDVTSASSVPGQFYAKVKDVYSCTPLGGKDYETDCAGQVTTCKSNGKTIIVLYFNMNH